MKKNLTHSLTRTATYAAFACLLALQIPAAFGANLVKNGSFENTNGTWVDTTCNYMSLTAGSGAIPGWTAAAATTGTKSPSTC
jgi:hypothetical protein